MTKRTGGTVGLHEQSIKQLCMNPALCIWLSTESGGSRMVSSNDWKRILGRNLEFDTYLNLSLNRSSSWYPSKCIQIKTSCQNHLHLCNPPFLTGRMQKRFFLKNRTLLIDDYEARCAKTDFFSQRLSQRPQLNGYLINSLRVHYKRHTFCKSISNFGGTCSGTCACT